MTGWALHDDPAGVGRRIRQARRELGFTQADLANRIGVSLGVLDRFETGKGDPSGKLAQIAEVTGRPVTWYTSTDQDDGGESPFETGLPAELRRRLAESSGRGWPSPEPAGEQRPGERANAGPELSEGLPESAEADTHRELNATVAVEPPDAADEGASAPADARPDATAPDDRLEDRMVLERQLQELRATLAVEQQAHDARAAQLADELEQANANRQALAAQLEQSSSELVASRAQEARLTELASQLESELRVAGDRAAQATAELDQAETDLQRLRHDERAHTEELERRAAELRARSDELDRREAAVTDAGKDVGFRSTQLDARDAELRFRAAQLDTRDAKLDLRSAQLDTREAELGVRLVRLEIRERQVVDADRRVATVDRRGQAVSPPEADLGQPEGDGAGPAPVPGGHETPEGVERTAPALEDVHLAVAPDNGYRLVARQGAAPDPGEIVELGDVRYRCVRVQASPFLGDERRCVVLELLPPEHAPSRATGEPGG